MMHVRFVAVVGATIRIKQQVRLRSFFCAPPMLAEAHGEFESEHPGYCGAQDTLYVGNLKSVGRIYQQTFIDTYTKVSFAKLFDRKTPITAADLLNDRVLPFLRSTMSSSCAY
jgi:hypothetical protein